MFPSLTDGQYMFFHTISVQPGSVTICPSSDLHADTGLVPGVRAGPDRIVGDLCVSVSVLPPVDPLVALLWPQSDGVLPGRVLVIVVNVVAHTGPLRHVLQDHQVSGLVSSTKMEINNKMMLENLRFFTGRCFAGTPRARRKGRRSTGCAPYWGDNRWSRSCPGSRRYQPSWRSGRGRGRRPTPTRTGRTSSSRLGSRAEEVI